MSCITNIPVDVILDNLFSVIPVPDLLRLGSTNRFFSTLLTDELFWKRKVQEDFNFPSMDTARDDNWRLIYRGLTNPQTFVWGETSRGRLGLGLLDDRGVPSPTRLNIPGVRIVNLVAGGMCFHALTSDGRLYVWGTLDGSTFTFSESDGFSEPGKQAFTPLKLDLPIAMRSISCGRLHSAALDVHNHIWMFKNWGRPFRLLSPLVDGTSDEFTAIQVICGWAFSSVLTKVGSVLVWWPHGTMSDSVTSKMDELDSEGNRKAHATEDGVIPCVIWDLVMDPIRLPAIPPLPKLVHVGEPGEAEEETRLVQIAGLSSHLIGLTNKGHVLKISVENENDVNESNWEYLHKFSEVEEVQKHEVFSASGDPPLVPPKTMHITHISAHFETFVTYSTGGSSTVLMGKVDFTPDSAPLILPALQNKSIISVVIGDYHSGALTSSGKLLTWGEYSLGALGLGDPRKLKAGTPGGYATERQRSDAVLTQRRIIPPAVRSPIEVKFSHGRKSKDMFCFLAAAAGWHTGALVMDLNPDVKDEEISENEVQAEFPEAGHILTHASPPFNPTVMPPTLSRGGFRIGFAGRGRGRRGRGG